MKNYLCNICNKSHTLYYNIDSPMPEELSESLNVNDPNTLFKIDDNIFVVNSKEVYIKGELEILLNFIEESFFYNLWCTFLIDEFRRKGEKLAIGESVIMNGEIISESPIFEKCKGLKVDLHINPNNQIGSIKIKEESQLKVEQSKPISKEHFIEINQRIHHLEPFQNTIKSKEKFDIKLTEYLELAIKEFEQNNNLFVINISNNRETIIQLVSGQLLENSKLKGIGIDIPNDKSNDNYEGLKDKMISVCVKLKIEPFEIAEIETYQKYYGTNLVELRKDLKILINDVFEENIENLDLDIFEP